MSDLKSYVSRIEIVNEITGFVDAVIESEDVVTKVTLKDTVHDAESWKRLSEEIAKAIKIVCYGITGVDQ